MIEESRFVHFTITGEFITELARDMIAEGRLREGERILMEYIDGMQHDIAIEILKGNKKIIGDSDIGLTLEDDDDQDVKTLLLKEYSGVVEYGGWFWKPYAVVTDWGRKDIAAGHIYEHPLYNRNVPYDKDRDLIEKLHKECRNVRYMDNKTEDMQFLLKYGDSPQHILWKKTLPPPYWLKTHNSNWQQALDDYSKHNYPLETRGHKKYFEDEGLSSEYIRDAFLNQSENDEPDDEHDELKPTPLESLIRETLPEHVADGMIDVLCDTEQSTDRPKPVENSEMDGITAGYILPDGKMYSCKYHGHDDLANRILKYIYNIESNDPTKEAENRGWLRVQKTYLGSTAATICKKPTRKQESTFEFWSNMNGLANQKIEILET